MQHTSRQPRALIEQFRRPQQWLNIHLNKLGAERLPTTDGPVEQLASRLFSEKLKLIRAGNATLGLSEVLPKKRWLLLIGFALEYASPLSDFASMENTELSIRYAQRKNAGTIQSPAGRHHARHAQQSSRRLQAVDIVQHRRYTTRAGSVGARSEKLTSPSATATAEPALEPPEIVSGSNAFLQGPQGSGERVPTKPVAN